MQRLEAHDLICRAITGDTFSRDTLIAYYCDTLARSLALTWSVEDSYAIACLAVVESLDSALLTYDASQASAIGAYLTRAITRALSVASYAARETDKDARKPQQRIALTALTEPLDTLTPEALAIQADTRDKLRAIFGEVLSSRDAGIMCGLYIEDMTARDVALLFSCSVGLVDKVRRNAIRALRSHSAFRALLLS